MVNANSNQLSAVIWSIRRQIHTNDEYTDMDDNSGNENDASENELLNGTHAVNTNINVLDSTNNINEEASASVYNFDNVLDSLIYLCIILNHYQIHQQIIHR
eukprot:355595_1